jgi:hypothetical protein
VTFAPAVSERRSVRYVDASESVSVAPLHSSRRMK